jgi:predicted RNA-binding Zn-ribbon protein involved in translation (DUF1610 family)
MTEEMLNTDYRCADCGWHGLGSETADDGPSEPVCCPLCGSSELVEHDES